MKQTALNLPIPPPKFPSLHEVITELVRLHGPRKQSVLAMQLGASPAHLSEVMRGDGSKHWPEAWIEYISKNYDPDGHIAACVARWSGREVKLKRACSDAEFRRRLTRTFAKHGALGEALIDEAMAIPADEIEDGQ